MENREYIRISVLILSSIIISTILSGVSSLVGQNTQILIKFRYECGFNPFGSRWSFSVKFFFK